MNIAGFVFLTDLTKIKWKRKKLLSIMAAMDGYGDLRLVWNPKGGMLWFLDVEHEEFRALCTWEEFTADPANYAHRMVEWACGA